MTLTMFLVLYSSLIALTVGVIVRSPIAGIWTYILFLWMIILSRLP